MRKLVVKLLALQCTVVKGSFVSLVVLFILVPLFIVLSPIAWLLDRSEAANGPGWKLLNTPIPFPGRGIIEEANQACNLNIKKYERLLGLRDKEPKQ